MKQFLTNINGGEPINLADFRWSTQGLFENTSALLSAVCPSDHVVILSGCVRTVSGSTVNVSAGWVAFSGEVFRVPAHVVTGTGTEYWTSQLVHDPTGLKTFNSGLAHDTYQEQIYSVIAAVTPPVGSHLFSDSQTLMQIISATLPKDSWHSFYTATKPPSSAVPGTYTLFCYVDLDGFVHVKGKLGLEDLSAPPLDILVSTLPIGYRPQYKREAYVQTLIDPSSGTMGGVSISIDTNGEVRIKSSTIGSAAILDFGQITPFMRSV